MIRIVLTSDPDTGRGLYDDEAQVLGRFDSLSDAEQVLGDVLRFCSIHPEHGHPAHADS
jgi:hypothetical protein